MSLIAIVGAMLAAATTVTVLIERFDVRQVLFTWLASGKNGRGPGVS